VGILDGVVFDFIWLALFPFGQVIGGDGGEGIRTNIKGSSTQREGDRQSYDYSLESGERSNSVQESVGIKKTSRMSSFTNSKKGSNPIVAGETDGFAGSFPLQRLASHTFYGM
jgi:hypothetical protein